MSDSTIPKTIRPKDLITNLEGIEIAKIKNFFSSIQLRESKKLYFCSGDMAEWSIAAVLKTVKPKGFGGSNPSVSAAEATPVAFLFDHWRDAGVVDRGGLENR